MQIESKKKKIEPNKEVEKAAVNRFFDATATAAKRPFRTDLLTEIQNL